MKRDPGTFRKHSGFSLAEVLATLTIGAMILVAVLGIYGRAERSAAAITYKFNNSRLPSEVLQRIAEDLDRIITSGGDTRIVINSKFDKRGYSTARLEIIKTYYDSTNKPHTFERIIWQTSYDYESDTDGLVLYRSYSGIGVEDKLLDESKENWGRGLFVPMCTGITFFKIQILNGDDLIDEWNSTSLPRGIKATISFAEPFKTATDSLDVPDETKTTRVITIDRTRKINRGKLSHILQTIHI